MAFTGLESQINGLKKEFNQKQEEIRELQTKIDSINGSLSWRIAKPIRLLEKIIRFAGKMVFPMRLRSVLGSLFKKKPAPIEIKDDSYYMKKAWLAREGFSIDPMAFGLPSEVAETQRKTTFKKSVKFSVLVPLYNTPKEFLQEMIASVLFQTYENWELCLADGSDSEHGYVEDVCKEIVKKDKRVKYKKLEKNGGIAENTNECIKMASGDYISLFDHDDLLHPSALFETMKAICEKNADFVYTDEATFESPDLFKIVFTNFKPDYAPDYFNTVNYVCHFSSFKKSLLKKIGGFDPATNGAQDYDLFLRIFEQTKKIAHVQKCLYFWRASPSSTASGAQAKSYTTDAGKLALEKHMKRCGIKATVDYERIPNTYKINYKIIGKPLVSILIPSYEHWKTLQQCIGSIERLTTYKNYEIIVIENNSKDKKTFDYYDSLKNDKRIRVITWKDEFNYSAINNFGFKYAKGDYILLLNNDIEVISPDWIQEMLMFAQRDDVGVVGAKLYYPSNKIQHGGVILGIGGVAGHSHKYYPRESHGCVSRLITVQDYSAVTAACCMIPRHVFKEISGLDEDFKVAFNDVDMCMRIRKAGYLIVWTPYAELYHYESESRGYEDTPEKIERFSREVKRFHKLWGKELLAGDPYYNPNLTLVTEDFVLNGNAVFGGYSQVKLPDFPTRKRRGFDLRNGLNLDYINENRVKDLYDLEVDVYYPMLKIYGWAFDVENNMCFSEIYIQSKNGVAKGDICYHRPDVAKMFKYKESAFLGFGITVPMSFLKKQGEVCVDSIKFYLVNKELGFIYEPIECSIVNSNGKIAKSNSYVQRLQAIASEYQWSLRQQILHSNISIQQKQLELDSLRASLSWKVTKPLRFFNRLVKHIKNR